MVNVSGKNPAFSISMLSPLINGPRLSPMLCVRLSAISMLSSNLNKLEKHSPNIKGLLPDFSIS